jgi:glycosyltransferase involved in cell wall biosynthesis
VRLAASGVVASGRIAVDVGPARTPATGVSVYLVELARALEMVAPGSIVRIGVRRDGPLADRLRDGDTELRGRNYVDWLLRRADHDARQAGCGLVHYTNALAPLGGLPFVLTIQDLSLIRMAGAHPRPRLVTIPLLVKAARAARVVIVPSEATRRELRRLLHVPDARIVTVPLAARTPLVGSQERQILDEFDLRAGDYILTIGTIEPRKNHVRLLAAFERLARGHPDLRLVIVGAWGWHSNRFRRALVASPVQDRVILTGHRTDGEVAALLHGCLVMAYPSLYEGFGLPVVEAMAAGIPVVTSRISSLPEAAGGSAVLVDPYDVGSIVDGLLDAMSRREELAAGGLVRVAGRTWRDVAAETVDVYRIAVNE